MEQGVSANNNFSLPKWDAKKISTTSIGVLLFGAIGFFIYAKVLPYLLGVVWGTIELVVGGVILALLLGVLSSKKFWRGMHYLTEGIARGTLGFIIEMNPFEILLERVEEGEKDRMNIKKYGDDLRAQQIKMSAEVDTNDKIMRQAAAEVKICQATLAKSPNDFDTQLNLQTSSTNFTNAKDYIDEVKPLLNNLSQLVDFSDKAYRKSGVELQNARSTIKITKAKYAMVTSANATMSSAMKAFFGNTDLNNDADQALEVLGKDIAKKLGNIKSSISITSEAMNHIDLRDTAKMSLAVEAAKQFEVDSNFDYSHSLDNNNRSLGLDQKQLSAAPTNRYSDFLNSKK